MRFAVAGILAVASLFAAGCGSGGGGGMTAAGGEAVSLSETEFKIDPATVNVNQSGTVTLRITNNGKIDHAFEIEGQGIEEQKTDTIGPGESADLTVELSKSGEYEFYCPVDGHRQQGMEGMLIVGGAGASGGTGGATTGEQEGTTGGGGYGSG
jgi:plastocyanin